MSSLRFLISVLPLFAFVMIGCKKEEENPANTFDRYFAGQWEQVEGPDRGCIYDISISSGDYDTSLSGQIKTYYLTATDRPLYDKEYSWRVRGVENRCPTLDLVCKEELDTDNTCSGNYRYIIIKLTDSFMWWQNNTYDHKDVLKFRRRPDLGNLPSE